MQVRPIVLSQPDDAFLTPLRERRVSGGAGMGGKKMAPEDPLVVAMLSLVELQIVNLANSLGITDAPAFINEIRLRDLWVFTRRPLDLIDLIKSWKAEGRLGTRSEHHAANVVSKLKEDPGRADRGHLSDEHAYRGAAQLALALTLTRTRTIRSPEQACEVENSEGVLDAARILTNWTEKARQALLRRALFDPATYGRIRFHHRSVQEYLAARQLQWLRERGMPARSLCHLLFAERYGLLVVRPSMRAIAAWLALWDHDVRRELMAREPETLISMGDAESLPLDARAELLRAFAMSYGSGGWRRLDIPIGEVRRLAHPELGNIVRELWERQPVSQDLSELLLDMIWQGPIRGCLDLAVEAAFDFKRPDIERVSAIRALTRCGDGRAMRRLSESMLQEPMKWPVRVIVSVMPDLFPSALDVNEIIAFIQRAHASSKDPGGIFWAVRQIVEEVDPLSELANSLRNALADLVWGNRQIEGSGLRLVGQFDKVAPALARLCDRQFQSRGTLTYVPDPCLVWASVVASRFGDDERVAGDLIKNLRKHFELLPLLREMAFWAEFKLAREAAKEPDAQVQCFRILHDGLVGSLTSADREWLLKTIQESSDPERRLIALKAMLSQGVLRQGDTFEELRAAVRNDVTLVEVLREGTQPTEPDETIERWKREERQQRSVNEARERQRLEGWLDWKKELLGDPAAAFSGEALPGTRRNLFNWLEIKRGDGMHYSVWDEDALCEVFGSEVAALAANAFRATWRAHPPPLRSQQSVEERNKILWVWAEGLTGLAAEARNPGWANCLTRVEARVAARYATIELNGFPSWLPDLLAAHPAEVDGVIGSELSIELAAEHDDSYAPTLQKLWSADLRLKRLLTPHLLKALFCWPSAFPSEERGRQSGRYLGQVLSVLSEVAESQDRAQIAQLCHQRFSDCPEDQLASQWLQGLFEFDAEMAARALDDSLSSVPEQRREGFAVAAFANLLPSGGALAFGDEVRQAVSLSRLLRLAYRYVRPESDQEHMGAYTPDLRDQAERAREFLLGALINTSGAKAYEMLIEVAEDSLFAGLADRLRLVARQRAATDAEGPPLSPMDVVELQARFEAPPQDRDGLFIVMVDRLEDLAEEVAHDDFSDRRTLQRIEEESEMQRTLARRLRDASKGAYIVSREEEVADLKKTDIRLSATRGGQKAAIEVKIADKWSFLELERALRTQLIGQYLRHDTCRAGCLLLTYHGRKTNWRIEGGRGLSFAQLMEQLRSLAHMLQSENEHRVRLAVCALDLTDPCPNAQR